MTDKQVTSFKLKFDNAILASTLTCTQKMVALAWASRCNYQTGALNDHPNNMKRTGIKKIASLASVAERTAIKATHDLVKEGWLESLPTPAGFANSYQLVILPPAPVAPPIEVPPACAAPLPCNHCTPTPATAAPIKNKKEEVQNTKDKNRGSADATPGSFTDSSLDSSIDQSSFESTVETVVCEEPVSAPPATPAPPAIDAGVGSEGGIDEDKVRTLLRQINETYYGDSDLFMEICEVWESGYRRELTEDKVRMRQVCEQAKYNWRKKGDDEVW